MRFFRNYLSTLGFIGLSWWIISDLSGFHRDTLQSEFHTDGNAVLHVRTVFLALAALYAVVLIPYYLRYPWLHSKAFQFLQGLYFMVRRLARSASPARRRLIQRHRWRLTLKAGLSDSAKQAALALLLKFFFAPLMINWCLGNVATMAGSAQQFFDFLKSSASGLQLFDIGYLACFQLILFVDTLLFTLGYIIELPALRNRIRSVDPTISGWFVCLICYPPFLWYSNQVLPWQSSDMPLFNNLYGWPEDVRIAIHVTAGVTMLLLMAVFSWASIALGFKASNLTNRGIVSHGPYALVRHPAYAAKNLAWWIGAVPTICIVFESGTLTRGIQAILVTLGWTVIYALRAITEERHLMMGKNGYAEYRARVRWRFIPGVF